MIQQTSLEGYIQFDECGELGFRQAEVFAAIRKMQPCTDKEIAKYLKREINTVVPRRRELQKLGKVEEGEVRKCNITGYSAQTWRCKF